ncbi:hypothetical protein RhiirA5_430490 [Rhizophagus irregularis]|uniref:F-box domain-containing protein n=1 Tax=Rhizophagus irregularis TaxID=588596 RepID=A0A2N0NWM8_9GLOM|nr:hypothetical protein RhiirA5_430490 [Rhizophagus irregularis]
MSQLPADCLNEIIEYLKDDKIILCSCLLVNRLWCETSVIQIILISKIPKIILYPKIKDCLKNLSEFQYHIISNELTDLISAQKNLKYFCLTQHRKYEDKNFTSSITNNLIGLNLYDVNYISLSFITNFQTYKNICSKCKSLIKFLENNGKSLKEFYLSEDHVRCHNYNSLNLAIANFCLNIRKLFVGFKHDNELESLKTVLNRSSLSEKEALEAVVKYSQNIHEIILYPTSDVISKLLQEELEAFFVSWINRITQKSLSLAIVTNNDHDCIIHSLDKCDKNMEIINEYIKLGVIKNFKIAEFNNGGFIF